MNLWDSKPVKHLNVMGTQRNADLPVPTPLGCPVVESPLPSMPWSFPMGRGTLCPDRRRCSPCDISALCHGSTGIFIKSHLNLTLQRFQSLALCTVG